jgi:hypothetical protein
VRVPGGCLLLPAASIEGLKGVLNISSIAGKGEKNDLGIRDVSAFHYRCTHLTLRRGRGLESITGYELQPTTTTTMTKMQNTDYRPPLREVIELQHPCGFRGRFGHPDMPSCGEKTQFVQLWPEDIGVKFELSFEECESERSRLR